MMYGLYAEGKLIHGVLIYDVHGVLIYDVRLVRRG